MSYAAMICLLCFSFLSARVLATPRIVVGGSDNLKLSVYGLWAELIYREAFKRHGYEFEYLGFPAARVARIFMQGKLDGEINRIASYGEGRADLIRVQEPHFSMNSVAYSHLAGLTLEGWDSFNSLAYRVEYRNGSKLFAMEIPPRMPAELVSKVTTTEQGVKRLILKRTDVFLELDLSVEDALAKLDPALYDVDSIKPVATLATKPSYLFLHRKHQQLAEKVAQTLREMKQQGVIEHYRQQAIALHSH
nr:transporter substrate-binding domain-containing protein [Motilimonas eburnea]